MQTQILFSFTLDGKEYKVANCRDVVRNACRKQPDLFDDFVKKSKSGNRKTSDMSFLEMFEASENSQAIMQTLFAYGVLECNPEISYEEACDVYEVLSYNLDEEQRGAMADKLMSLIANTDFIKGSNQRKAQVKIML